MATLSTSFHGLTLSSVPLINLRLDFNGLLALFRSEHFREQFKGHRGEPIPIRTQDFTWHGRTNVLLTHLLRDAIVSLESAVSGAVFVEALRRGVMTDEILQATKDPLSIKKRGTANCVFNALPGMLNESYSLERRDPELWEEVRTFYREVRNPLFHAYEVGSNDPEPVWKCLELIWRVFGWLNSWHPIENLVEGPVSWNPQTLKAIAEIPVIDELTMRRMIPRRSLPAKGREHLQHLPSDMTVVQIEETRGMYLGTDEMLDITMRDAEGKPVKLLMSPHSAMQLLKYLAIAHEKRGWQIPDDR